MPLLVHSIRRIASTLIILAMVSAHSSAAGLNEAERVSVVKKWLPYYHAKLQLIFEYDSEKQGASPPSSEHMHKAIDKAGPTVSIIEAQIGYEETSRIVGGYNPNKWKNWLGRYESNAGRFVFSIDSEKRWERNNKRIGSFKSKPADYGIAFGDGDLVINPDLITGSARDSTFTTPSDRSVLIGQAGDFVVKSFRIYRVIRNPLEQVAQAPIPHQRVYNENTSPSPVPDQSFFLFEIGLILAGLSLFSKFVGKR